MDDFRTEIVNTKEFGKGFSKILSILMTIVGLYVVYILLWDIKPLDKYAKYIIIVFYLFVSYILIQKSFIKPKSIGYFSMNMTNLAFPYKGIDREINYSTIEKLSLKYTGYGSWNAHSIYGNKNYLIIEIKDEEKFSFEILIRNKKHKDTLRKILDTKLLDTQFEFIKLKSICEY